ncbi:phage portal protein [Lachnospiraceae bacterium 29-91]
MGILDRIFRKREEIGIAPAQKFIIEPAVTFTAYSGDAYGNDIYRGAVDAIARNIGKLKGSHVIRYADHDKVDGDCRLNRLLQVRPNPYMSAYDMLYKIATHYYLNNNAFALLQREGRSITGIYPVTASSMQMLNDRAGDLYCKFFFRSGRTAIFPYADVIHMRRNFNNDELLGDGNSALDPALELAHTQNQGIISGIRAGANIRGILKFTQIMSPAKLKEEKEAFINDYLQVSNDGGVVATDQKMEYVPIENKPVILTADQTQEVKAKIYDYLGITESIVNSSYTEDQFSAFYESTIEPFAVALSMEFTAKVFTDRELAYGNSIMFESGRLQFSSNSTKVSLIKELLPMGLLTVNQALEILNLPSIEDGDRRIQSLNYIDQERATEYQLANAGKKEEEPS